MNDPFTLRVRAAAVAGWWTVLLAVAFATLLWAVYRFLFSCHPAWVLRLWGPEITWPVVRRIMLRVIVVYKFVVWWLTLAVVWLTLWARQLKKQAGAA